MLISVEGCNHENQSKCRGSVFLLALKNSRYVTLDATLLAVGSMQVLQITKDGFRVDVNNETMNDNSVNLKHL